MNEIKIQQLNVNEKNYSNLLKIDLETLIAYNQEGYELLDIPLLKTLLCICDT